MNMHRTLIRTGLVLLAAVTATPVALAADDVATIELTATIRDFKAYHEPGGHPDFQKFTGTTRVGLLQDELGPDGKPVFRDSYGWHIASEFKDADGRNVNPRSALAGDIPGAVHGSLQDGNGVRITSAESFHSWYRDVPGVNMSIQVPIVLAETESGSGVFVFDSANRTQLSKHNPLFEGLPRNGFFPINDQGWGNYASFGGGTTNFHFTTEISTLFTYQEDEDLKFRFTGDDDVWVFINGQLVIDLGGVHPVREQWVHLDTIPGLEDGETYSLKIFHAERRTTQSNFRVETTIQLRPLASASTWDAFD